MNGHHWTLSAAAATTEAQDTSHLEPPGMFFFLLCYFYYTNDYLKLVITTNGGRRAQDVSQFVSTLKYVFLYTTLMIILKAAKCTNGDDRGSREENEKKKGSRCAATHLPHLGHILSTTILHYYYYVFKILIRLLIL